MDCLFKPLKILIFLGTLKSVFAQDGCVILKEQGQTVVEKASAQTWYETPSIVTLSPECTGDQPLGMESRLITKQQISASSSWNKLHNPNNGRLNYVTTRGYVGAWASKAEDQNQWFEVDFRRNVKITKFATQGRQDANQYVTKYQLKYSTDGAKSFQTYQENGDAKTFNGNRDQNSIVTHTLAGPIIARYVQIKPIEWYSHISLRAEFYGCTLSDRYQIVGRNVHMEFVEEKLRVKEGVKFSDTQILPNNIDVEILADTIYVKTALKMRGMKKLTMFSRKVVFLEGGRLDLRAPALEQSFTNINAGQDGADGYPGVDGAHIEIYADSISGDVNIETNGGNGNRGQTGGNGKNGADKSSHKQPDKTENNCKDGQKVVKSQGIDWVVGCVKTHKGLKGAKGGDGMNGGYGGRSGKGGNAGQQTLFVRKLDGNLNLKTCRGAGGPKAANGRGGKGGNGGQGGKGVECYRNTRYGSHNTPIYECKKRKTLGATNGDKGSDGKQWQGYIAQGANGQVQQSFLKKQNLEGGAKDKYPLAVIKMMVRLADDKIWANDIATAEAVLNFVVMLTEGRDDAVDLRKLSKKRLAFLNKPGFDRFGRNLMFAPLMKWEAFRDEVVRIRDYARDFETSYNRVQASIERNDNAKQIADALPSTAITQVTSEKDRLIEERRVSQTEKGAYVPAIKDLEELMESILARINQEFPALHDKASFSTDDMFAVLQGTTGFLSALGQKDPIGAVDSAVGTAGYFATRCNTGTLQENLNSINKWMSFGVAYKALEDSSDLDFDQMDITSVPEVMMANLEMNKEGLAADLTCMMEEKLKPNEVAKFKELIERFYISGSARIDLIAKVIDLDNDIGQYNFDIQNLEETVNELESLRSNGNSPVEDSIQQMFLDNLLTSYQKMESGFSKQLYMFYKSFEFRTLWDVSEKMFEYERSASEAATGNGQLDGVVELNKALITIDELESKGRHCFTRFIQHDKVHKWSFNNVDSPALFEDLHNGKVQLSLGLGTESCPSCYNVRLLKMYIELYGDTTQDDNGMPAMVHLKIRHGSSSSFKDGTNKIKTYKQKLASTSWRKFEFNRYAITNPEQCNEEIKEGKSDSLFCLRKDDFRLRPMCCHFLSNTPCDDALSGSAECQSLFGTYTIEVPINENAKCSGSHITDKNCKDFNLSAYTKMNAWFHFMYWSDSYPTGPEDPRCGTANGKKKSETPNVGETLKNHLTLTHLIKPKH